MGVPKFFRYTSERYPCLNELVKQYQIPDFDNMYLDMNGIIHICSHPDDSNAHFRITEEKIFEDIFHYLTILFQIITPKKLFFMAIDGVAPRAKMNQQRARRFRSAQEAEKLEEDAKSKGEVLPTEKRFDSNCITPGTAFMARLHEQLRYFVKYKMSTDPLWSKVKVILSGHETPGEGEHKIMDYIRWSRSQPDYDPNTRHCLYGLDADLIILGLCTHEPHFALLREEVKFGKSTQRATSPEDTNFYLLHLSLLKEYLEQEFIAVKDSLPFDYDIEKIVDDWVLMVFLVGNDFIPHLPNMHISNDAMPVLYKTYMDVLPKLDGYINESGELNLRRFEAFMQELAKIDKEKFQDTYADLKYFEAKTGRRPNANERKEYKPNNDETFNVDVSQMKGAEPDEQLQALINATQEMFMDDMGDDDDDDGEYEDIDTSDDEANFNMEFILHKKDYYMNKLDYSKVTDEVLASQAEGYVRAIQWNLHYYYRGCPSWCWYYPHHYAPYISDIKGFANLDIKFELGEPFKPFEQLLAVLPAASKQLLPTPFHSLMTDEDSPIVHYYPINFETDLNGKINDWEAVVLIPFIDETNLLVAMEPCYQRLTDEERRRNIHGPMLIYHWDKEGQGPLIAPEYFPSLEKSHAVETRVWRQDMEVKLSQLKRGVLPNAMRHLLFPGFPTMRHLKYTSSLKKCKVKVFDQPSRNENMIVQLVRDGPEKTLEETARHLLGKVIWVGWPHLTKALVISVSNEKQRLHRTSGGGFNTETNAGNLHKQWISERSTVIEHNMNRLGIELGDVTTLVHAINIKGYKYTVQDNVRMALEPEWCTVSCGYALQAIVTDVSAHIMEMATKFSTPEEAYPVGDKVFLLTQGAYYGCEATVVESSCARSGRIKVSVHAATAAATAAAAPPPAARAPPYRPALHAASYTGISTQLLSRVTGVVLVVPAEHASEALDKVNKTNIGLNLKFNKKNLEVSGYTRRCPINNTWLYSERCVRLVSDYVRQFPDMFDRLACAYGKDVHSEADLFPGEAGKGKLQEVSAWIKAQPHMSAPRRECGSEALEAEELTALAKHLDDVHAQHDKQTQPPVTLHVKWSLLYKSELHQGNLAPDASADFRLYDRVVCVADNITVPKGATGTITAIYKPSQHNTVRLSDKLNAEDAYQVLFDKPFPGAMTEPGFSEPRLYRMQPSYLINISYGRKLREATAVSAVAAADSEYGQNNTVLRRGVGHTSAFASYSPPKEPCKYPSESRITVNTKAPMTQEKDDSSELLKNLLKISSNNSTDNTKGEKKTSKEDTNWRSKKESMAPVTPLSQSNQQSWRNEPTPRVQPPGEWINSKNKGQQPPAPFPNLSSIPLPAVSHAAFPFPTPAFPSTQHYQPNSQQPRNYQANSQQPPNYQANSQQPQSYQPNRQPPHHYQHNQWSSNVPQNGQFPTSLPNVPFNNMNVGLQNVQRPDQKTNKNANQSNTKNANLEKLINPFVPLQVQASQRRVQNPRGPSTMREGAAAAAAAKPTPLHPPQYVLPKSNPESSNEKSRRKRRPRIAANLPFQME